MTSKTDIFNRALQNLGTRTTVTDADIAGNLNNEAKQGNLIYDNARQDLIRMAPWACAFNTANLVYITSANGTTENTSPAATLWAKGLPPPPWLYEYQYPVDCIRACRIVPQYTSGFTGIPITSAITGNPSGFWNYPPAKFNVAVDQFYPVTAAAVVAGGAGYVVGEIITLASGASTSNPIGAPAKLQVATIGGGGAVATVTVVNQVNGSATNLGGSYFLTQTNPVAQGSSTGAGTGATFNLTFGAQDDQRVILTNQQSAILGYCRDISNPNVFDTLFQSALINLMAGQLCMALTGDKAFANFNIQLANKAIEDARSVDGNESLTIIDSTPDWIRTRGMNFNVEMGDLSFEWGGLWPLF